MRLFDGDAASAQKEQARILAKLNNDLNSRDERFQPAWGLDAEWSAISDMWPETVKALKAGVDASAAYAAELYLNTGKIEDGLKDAKDVVDRILKWSRRKPHMDIVKQELALGWHHKGYRKMGKELADAIEKATKIRLPIKTIRSLANGLDLITDDSVKPGAKSKIP